MKMTSIGSSQDWSGSTPSAAMDFYPGIMDNTETTLENNSVLRCVDDQVSTPSIYQTVVFFALAFITVTSNLVFIVIVLKTKSLRKKTNYILVSMAGADLMVGLISEPIWGLALWVDDKDHKYLTTAKFVVHFSLMSSVSHLLVVTLERTRAVLIPSHYKSWVTCRRVQMTIACTWLWSLFVAALHPFVWSSYSYYLFIVWTGLLVLIFVAVLHCLMRKALKKATSALQELSSNSTESAAVRNARLRERRTTKLVTIITFVFAICVLPSVFSETLCYLDVITQVTKNFINLLFFLNSFINPIIFAIHQPKFRTAVKAMCGCQTPKSNLTATPCTNGRGHNLRLNPSRPDTSDYSATNQQDP